EYRRRGGISPGAGPAPDESRDEVALERDHVRRTRGLPLERIRGDLFGPDSGLCGALAEIGYGEIPDARAARGSPGELRRGNATQARPPHVVRMKVPALEDRDEDRELVRRVMPVDIVRRIGLRVAGCPGLGERLIERLAVLHARADVGGRPVQESAEHARPHRPEAPHPCDHRHRGGEGARDRGADGPKPQQADAERLFAHGRRGRPQTTLPATGKATRSTPRLAKSARTSAANAAVRSPSVTRESELVLCSAWMKSSM